MKFNITYDSQIFSWQRYGGISRIYKELIQEYIKDPSLRISVTGRYHINEYLNELKANEISKINYFPKMEIFPGKINQILNRKYLFGVKNNKSCNIFHETYFDSFATKIPASTSRVISVYDMIDEKFGVNKSIRSKISLRDKEISIKRADHVICISENTRTDLIEILGIPKIKTSVVYLGSEMMENVYKDNSSPSKNINNKYILYVGSRGGYKNFKLLLESIDSSLLLKKNFTLVAFGGGKFSKNETEIINKMNINAFQLSGSDAMLSSLYKKASIFVYPSMYEGFGIPPLEAMRFGCPVICSNNSSISEVVGDAGRYFKNNDPESLKMAMENVLDSQKLRNNLIELGYKRAKIFSWNKCAQDTLNVYKKINN